MLLNDILNKVNGTLLQGDINVDIKDIVIDSRMANKNTLFVAMIGLSLDGHEFILKAYDNGCRAVIIERDVINIPQDMIVFKVDNAREALSVLAANFYDSPSSKINMIGVTGTNGKTSTTYFIESILKYCSRKTGVIGTVGITIDGKKQDIKIATSTTPDILELSSIIDIMHKDKCDDVIMEVSSHGLDMKRVDNIRFNIGVFTNLTQDHLDYHKTMDNYCKAKAKLFNMCEYGIINVDDEYSDEIIKNASCKIMTYSTNKPSDLQAKNIVYKMDKVLFTVSIKGQEVAFELNVPGAFSVYNCLSAIGVALNMDIPLPDIVEGVRNIKGVPGRIQNISNDKGFNVIVDYAHTPAGLENIISTVREFTTNNVITVFGCGGDRDKTKRPIMGEVVAKMSDMTFITSDNPRTEEPKEILKDIEAGVKPITDKYEMIVDRKEAIFKAILMAKAGDSVIIAGKGHEDYQILKDKTIHFDDVEVAKEALGDI